MHYNLIRKIRDFNVFAQINGKRAGGLYPRTHTAKIENRPVPLSASLFQLLVALWKCIKMTWLLFIYWGFLPQLTWSLLWFWDNINRNRYPPSQFLYSHWKDSTKPIITFFKKIRIAKVDSRCVKLELLTSRLIKFQYVLIVEASLWKLNDNKNSHLNTLKQFQCKPINSYASSFSTGSHMLFVWEYNISNQTFYLRIWSLSLIKNSLSNLVGHV